MSHPAHARIREFWVASGRTRSDEAVPLGSRALGLARTGRVVTAAAVVMSISFAALIAAEMSFMRMFGLGLTLALLADATLVRMVSMPAFMHVMGEWNWWAPKWLSRIHDRFGLDHGKGIAATEQSSSKGPLNEAVAVVVSTMRRVP